MVHPRLRRPIPIGQFVNAGDGSLGSASTGEGVDAGGILDDGGGQSSVPGEATSQDVLSGDQPSLTNPQSNPGQAVQPSSGGSGSNTQPPGTATTPSGIPWYVYAGGALAVGGLLYAIAKKKGR